MSEEKNNWYACDHCANAFTGACGNAICIGAFTNKNNPPSNFKLKTDTKEEYTYEYVDHPSHYGGKDNPYECIKVIEAWGLDKNFDLGTAVRYICRAGEKPDNPVLQDLKKARWYLDREIKKLEEK